MSAYIYIDGSFRQLTGAYEGPKGDKEDKGDPVGVLVTVSLTEPSSPVDGTIQIKP